MSRSHEIFACGAYVQMYTCTMSMSPCRLHDDIDSFDSYKFSDTADAHFFNTKSVCFFGTEGQCTAQSNLRSHDNHVIVILLLFLEESQILLLQCGLHSML